jgi:hypothetical protein
MIDSDTVDDEPFVDGNAVAGDLGMVFVGDITTAIGQCAGCGWVATVAEARVYTRSPGLVARCSRCEAVLLRLVRTPGSSWLDLRGLVYLRLPANGSGQAR